MAKKHISLALLVTMSPLLCYGFLNTISAGAAVTKHAAAAQLAKDEIALSNAVETFTKAATKLTNSSTAAQDEVVAKPLALAFQSFQARLLSQSWPTSIKADLRMVYSANSPVIADLLTLRSVSAFSTSAWVSTTGKDLVTWVGDVNIINHDLSMPPFSKASAVSACNADAATIRIAIEAFDAVNPGKVPTKQLLQGNADGGPYLQSWPHNLPYYSISISAKGKVMVAAPSKAKPVVYSPTVCNAAF